jgi:hypothetical protein
MVRKKDEEYKITIIMLYLGLGVLYSISAFYNDE